MTMTISEVTLSGGRDRLTYQVRGDGTVEIVDVVVTSERRTGRGRELLRLLFGRLDGTVQTVYAITRAENMIAQSWYEACGFEVTGVLRRFYERDSRAVDAILYGRSPRGPL